MPPNCKGNFSVRDQLNKHPVASSALVAAALVLAVFVIIQYLKRPGYSLPAGAFFTSDDGRTWFEKELTNIPPFESGGGSAVGCSVFAARHDGTQFVGILSKFSDHAKADLDALVKSGASVSAVRQAMMNVPANQRLCKLPGSTEWIPVSDVGAQMKMSKSIKAPDGTDDYMMVSP
jgi:hypothetical protein